MKLNQIICSVAVGGILACGLTGCVTEEKNKAKLQAEAKVSRADAEKTALAKVPGGTIKEGELEKEKGKLIWSFDISIPGSTDIREVQVDAITGQVVSVETETGAAEAKEKKKEKEEDEKEEKK
jgi:peptidase YpeB-like protein